MLKPEASVEDNKVKGDRAERFANCLQIATKRMEL